MADENHIDPDDEDIILPLLSNFCPPGSEAHRDYEMLRARAKQPKEPPKEPISSVQYDLFTTFLANDESAVSNTVEIWESIPKYFFTPRQVEKLRTTDGLAKPYKREYVYNDMACTVKVQPALIEQEEGIYKAFFPSVTEELVEEALKKILTDQNQGIHDPQKQETWVRFSLRMVQKELKVRGKSRSINEIKHAVEVMSKCNIALLKGRKEIWNGSILQDLVTVDREEYIVDPKSHHVARLPLFISHAIDKLEYRQYNYDRHLRFDSQLTRWINKRLVNRYKQASLIDTYHFMYSVIKQGSVLLEQTKESDNRRKVLSALDELQNDGVILSYQVDEIKDGRRIKDVKYTITAAPDFVREQKAANKRAKLQLVDKSG